VGGLGEKIASDFLKKSGYRVIEKNFRSRYGEIDIIALDGQDIVFVEVKLRNNLSFGSGREAVSPAKQLRIIKSAVDYIKKKSLEGRNVRFDVIEVCGRRDTVEHIKSAFGSSRLYTL